MCRVLLQLLLKSTTLHFFFIRSFASSTYYSFFFLLSPTPPFGTYYFNESLTLYPSPPKSESTHMGGPSLELSLTSVAIEYNSGKQR